MDINNVFNGNDIKFVDREQEMRNIELSINRLLKQALTKSIIEFNGIGGIGKTVILNNIADTCRLKNLTHAKYDFSIKIKKETQDIRIFIRNMIDQIKIITNNKNKLENLLSNLNARVEDIEKLFIGYIQEIIKEKKEPIALIFDSLDEITETVRNYLSSLISNTIDAGRIIFILASKSSLNLPLDERVQKRWQTYRLTQFTTNETKNQIETFETALPPEELEELSRNIFNITRGHPLGNNLVWKEFKEKSISIKNFRDNTQLFLQTILEDVIKVWVFKGYKTAEQKKLRSILQPLSIARLFNLISLQLLIDEFSESEYQLPSSYYYSNYIRELQSKTNFVRYEPAKSGYIVDPTLANAFSMSLKQSNAKLYKEINQRLIEVYTEWIKKSTGTDKIKYIKEKYYHKLKIDIPINEIVNEFKKDLDEFRGKENEHLRLQFREELENDYDLCNILKDNISILTDYIKDLK